MELTPKLIDVAVPSAPAGAVIVLHGGARRGDEDTVSPTQLSVLRMIPVARRIVRAGKGRLAVFRLLNSRRGWQDSHTPVQDVGWALRELEARWAGVPPVCLVGHSLGGRAALLSAGEPAVRSVVALAPWVLPSDVPRGFAGKPILIVHGTRDRMASPARSAELARRMAAVPGAQVEFVAVSGGRHAMLTHRREFSGRAARFAADTLLGDDPAVASAAAVPLTSQSN